MGTFNPSINHLFEQTVLISNH